MTIKEFFVVLFLIAVKWNKKHFFIILNIFLYIFFILFFIFENLNCDIYKLKKMGNKKLNI